ncbi:MAG: DUF1016 N-terminal domain-containing protein [Eubacteriales bacterium]
MQYLSQGSTLEFGKGFTVRNLQAMYQFYFTFNNTHTLCAELSWSHYRLLMRIDYDTRREFYHRESMNAIGVFTYYNKYPADFNISGIYLYITP